MRKARRRRRTSLYCRVHRPRRTFYPTQDLHTQITIYMSLKIKIPKAGPSQVTETCWAGSCSYLSVGHRAKALLLSVINRRNAGKQPYTRMTKMAKMPHRLRLPPSRANERGQRSQKRS